MVSADRTYWHVPGARSWHACRPSTNYVRLWALCGRNDAVTQGMAPEDPRRTQESDRLPSTAHLCGNCARVIAARTDVEA